jgi:hypothetical protein
MSKAQHTPGSWRATQAGATVKAGVIDVAYMSRHLKSEQERKANANLSAAAPDLLAALEANHKWHLEYDDSNTYHGSELWTKNTEAIAKAKGESA